MGRQAHPVYLDSPFHRKRGSKILSGFFEIGCRDFAEFTASRDRVSKNRNVL